MKEGRRLGGVHAGPESRVLEGVSWEEARQMQDAAPSSLGKKQKSPLWSEVLFTSICPDQCLRNRDRNKMESQKLSDTDDMANGHALHRINAFPVVSSSRKGYNLGKPACYIYYNGDFFWHIDGNHANAVWIGLSLTLHPLSRSWSQIFASGMWEPRDHVAFRCT